MVAHDVVPATVRDHDPGTSAGTALLDDGTATAYGREAVAAGRLRLLRSGQRVDLHRDGQGAVLAVTLPGDPPART